MLLMLSLPRCWDRLSIVIYLRPLFASLAKFVAKSARRTHNLSSGEDTFSALNVTPLDKVRVVIVGQDPYHGPGRLTGFAFLFYPDKLFHRHQNIYRSYAAKAVNFANTNPTHGHLMRWAKAGVLMTNNVLTVLPSLRPTRTKELGDVTDENHSTVVIQSA
jgi:uracil-DNA glycosylase